MRSLALAALLFVPLSMARAENDTAYKALRVFGKQHGEQFLNRVIELRGRAGSPQPQVWRITTSDPAARAGVVEVEVQRGKVISQRTPTARSGGAGALMDLNRLNLDSDGAFTIADQEMQRRGVPFDRIDYLLRSALQNQPPVWQLELFDRGAKVAVMHVAADSGSILDHEVFAPSGPSRSTSRDRDYVEAEREHTSRSTAEDVGESVGTFLRRVGRHFEKRGHQLKNFFTGEDRNRR